MLINKQGPLCVNLVHIPLNIQPLDINRCFFYPLHLSGLKGHGIRFYLYSLFKKSSYTKAQSGGWETGCLVPPARIGLVL